MDAENSFEVAGFLGNTRSVGNAFVAVHLVVDVHGRTVIFQIPLEPVGIDGLTDAVDTYVVVARGQPLEIETSAVLYGG